MKVLITGASGFTGTRMIEILASDKDNRIIGLARQPSKRFFHRDNVSWVQGDILDEDAITRTVSQVSPDAIIHLAGKNQGSLKDLLSINVTGTRNILNAALLANPDCRILVISSSAVYGYAGENAIDENQPLKPVTEYGISKTAQDNLSRMYHEIRECQVAIARPFNLTGPGQPATLLCGKILHQVFEIENGKRSFLDLIETRSCRDFIDVRDVTRAYWAIISHEKFDEICAGNAFNIGSGIAYPLSKVIDLVQEITGTEYPLNLSISSPLITVPSQKSDNTRIYCTTGWAPRITLKESLSDMLAAERKTMES